eukprot:Gb_38689 [translate_table: standard]
MEGLIPYIYRAVVGHRGQRIYRNLSAADSTSGRYAREQKIYGRLPRETDRPAQDLKEVVDYNFPAPNRSLHRRAMSCFSCGVELSDTRLGKRGDLITSDLNRLPRANSSH